MPCRHLASRNVKSKQRGGTQLSAGSSKGPQAAATAGAAGDPLQGASVKFDGRSEQWSTKQTTFKSHKGKVRHHVGWMHGWMDRRAVVVWGGWVAACHALPVYRSAHICMMRYNMRIPAPDSCCTAVYSHRKFMFPHLMCVAARLHTCPPPHTRWSWRRSPRRGQTV